MPRLDVWLVEKGHFSSRQVARRAIKGGQVTVNGCLCKPSKQVTGKESIIIHSECIDVPKGFHKLETIDRILNGKLIPTPCFALDIGSSAGGFLSYLIYRGAKAIGIEISNRFTKELQRILDSNPNISVIITDAFKIEPTSITDRGTLDLLLIDVTTRPTGTLSLISKYASLLKRGGRLVAAFKLESRNHNVLQVLDSIHDLGFEDVQSIKLDETSHEIHIIACYG